MAREQVPDTTTLLKFRRLLGQHDLTAAILAEVNAHLAQRGLLMRQGTVVDATIIAAPSSTENEDGKRDPEMHQAKKGDQWHFGMKMHIGVDADSGLIHSVHTTAASEADVAHAHELLHGQDARRAWGCRLHRPGRAMPGCGALAAAISTGRRSTSPVNWSGGASRSAEIGSRQRTVARTLVKILRPAGAIEDILVID